MLLLEVTDQIDRGSFGGEENPAVLHFLTGVRPLLQGELPGVDGAVVRRVSRLVALLTHRTRCEVFGAGNEITPATSDLQVVLMNIAICCWKDYRFRSLPPLPRVSDYIII